MTAAPWAPRSTFTAIDGAFHVEASERIDYSLVQVEGVTVVDDTLTQVKPWTPEPPGASAHGEATAALDVAVAVAVAADPRVEQVRLSLRDGLTLIRRTEA